MDTVAKDTITWYSSPMGWASVERPGKGKTFEKKESVAMIVEDITQVSSHRYTMFLTDKGGPIISGSSLEDVRKKFKDAFKMCLAVKSLMSFSAMHTSN